MPHPDSPELPPLAGTRHLETLVALMREALVGGATADSVFADLTRSAARGVGVERAGIWSFTPERDAIRAVALHRASGDVQVTPDDRIEARDVPAYFEALARNEVIDAHDAGSDPRTREFRETYLEPLGIGAMLDTPVFVEGRLWGVLCLEHVGGVRRWTSEEQTLALSMANIAAILVLERARAESEERFRLVAGATSDAIWDWNLADDSVWWSEGVEHLFGHRRDEVAPRMSAWMEFVHPRDLPAVTERFDEVLRSGGDLWSAEYRFRRADGGWARVVDRGHIVRDHTGQAVRAVGGMTDVTERREIEERLRHAQRIESVGRLAAGIAHDFNNLLTSILGLVEFQLEAAPPGEELHQDLEAVRDAAGRAGELTRKLLAFSRQQVLEPVPLDLDRTVGESVRMLRRLMGSRVWVDFEPSGGLPPVLADPGQIEQVLVNLVVNARDATPAGGRVRIRTGRGTLRAGGSAVVVTVADEGEGMPQEVRERAFDPFFTTKPPGEGTGLGLATVHGIVHQSGGEVHLESIPGEGTTVRVLLPVIGEG